MTDSTGYAKCEEDPISPEEFGKLFTEELSEEDRELVEYGSQVLCSFPGSTQINLEDLEVLAEIPEYTGPFAHGDMARSDLFRFELGRVLSIFLTPSEVEQAISDTGTPAFEDVLAYLKQVQKKAGKVNIAFRKFIERDQVEVIPER